MTILFWRQHLIIPLFTFTIVLGCIEWLDIDITVSSYLYQLQGNQWALKYNWLLENILHTGARNTSILLALSLIFLFLSSFKYNLPFIDRKSWGYLLLTALLSAFTIVALKKITQVDCPWNIQNFGGELSYLSIYQARPINYPSASCFPAGHASSGYAWLGIFYLLKKHAPKYRYYGLGGVILAGVILGITQQVRGAHFLSHDIWTLVICWSIATVLAPIILKQRNSYHARVSG